MKNRANYARRRYFGLFILPTALFLLIFLSVGCQQAPQAGETYRKIAVAWPLFDFKNTKGVKEDGTTWEKEKGDACFWLSIWEKERGYDKDGFLIYRKEKSGFFPFYIDELEESKEFREHKGMVLLFPFYSRQVKTGQKGAEL